MTAETSPPDRLRPWRVADPPDWLEPLPLDATPPQVAAGLADAGPMVWLDAAMPGGWRATLLAPVPAPGGGAVIEGSIADAGDRGRLRRLAADAAAGGAVNGAPADAGWPRSVVVGAVGFDGRFRFGRCDRLLWHDPRGGCWFGDPGLARQVRPLVEGAWPARERTPPTLRFCQRVGRGEFRAMVRRAQDYIAAGDIYQVNLARLYESAWPADGDALALFLRLRQVSPAPHACYLDWGDGVRVLSVSPETFLKFDGLRVVSQPIKGTRPRGASAAKDAALAQELASCPKEAAELVMITDLLRNDLGQVCEFGSVRVPELLALRRFSHVQHLVSTIEGRLRSDLDAWEALAACMPGGSISGAPKLRALEIIAELERDRRGLYTGALGWLGPTGTGEFSIAIRTLVIEGGRVHFHVGAGVVADSVPDREHDETGHKAAGLLQACAGEAG